ncbi:MAG: hypothetical protein LBE82_08770 [Chitinophagaceae bacterium]|jgi:antitoxin VapB|nr:hypothetical protein [Chitinophagaceae bacterium]
MKIETVDIQNISGSQAIQLPDEFKIDDNKVYLKKRGNIIYVIPYHNAMQNFYDSLSEFTSDFIEQRNQPAQQNHQLFD